MAPIPFKHMETEDSLPLPLIRCPLHFLPKEQGGREGWGAKGKIQLNFNIDLLQKKERKKMI